MGFLDRLLGRDRSVAAGPGAGTREDERALERYRYLMRTAPPDDIERVHEEAFAKLTPEQRTQLRHQLTRDLPDAEARAAADDPKALAQLATRAELRQPGSVERALAATPAGNAPDRRGGPGIGTMFAGSLLGSVAGMVIGTAIAQQLFAGRDLADARDFDDDDPRSESGPSEDAETDLGSDTDTDWGGGGGDFD